MKQSRFIFLLLTTLGVGCIVAYYVASVLGNTLLCNVLSALVALVAAGILYYSYRRSPHKISTGCCLSFCSLACFFWFLGDLWWLIVSLQGRDPSESVLCTTLYTVTNIFLAVAVLFSVFFEYRKWRSLQLVLDTITVALLSSLLFWNVFFKNDSAWLTILFQDGISSALCISLDFLLMVGLLSSTFYHGHKKTSPHSFLFGLGLVLFCSTDLYYYYIFANHQYIPNTLLDVMYVVALVVISLSGLYAVLFGHRHKRQPLPDASQGQNRWLYLFLFPLLTLLTDDFSFYSLLNSFLIIGFYKALNVQVQHGVEKERLYQKEKDLAANLEQRVEAQYSELLYLANHDTVTDLYNRRYFMKALENQMNELGKSEVIAVFLIDLDRFKTINDTYGHDAGDRVLMEISARLQHFVDRNGVLARLGGDEFALFYAGSFSSDAIKQLAQSISEACCAPISINKKDLQVTLSLGIALYPNHAGNRSDLMKHSDIAMYRAKSQGYNKYVIYDPFFMENQEKKLEIEILLRNANIANDFELYYQPQFDILDNRLIGAEALLRWKTKEHGFISPQEFIPIAEEIDYILKLGEWVLRQAIEQAIQWNTTYGMDLKIGINISPKQLRQEDFLSIFRSFLEQGGCKATWIDAEITEGILLESDEVTHATFKTLKELGVSLSIDDFGSGYSSLGYLSQYQFDRIKIDQQLIVALSEENGNGRQLVKAVLSMAETIGVEVIAEGVEQEEQLEALKLMNCRQVQGFFLGRPVPAAVFEEIFIQTAVAAQ